MQNPDNQNFSDQSAKEICAQLFNNIFPKVVNTNRYGALVGTLQQLTILFPSDARAIQNLLSAQKAVRRSGVKSVDVNPLELTQGKLKKTVKDETCASCPPVEVYEVATPEPERTAKGAQLPPELLQPVAPAPAYVKPQEEMTFEDGDTVEEILKAHGEGVLTWQEVKGKLQATLQMKGIGFDARQNSKALAQLFLDYKNDLKEGNK